MKLNYLSLFRQSMVRFLSTLILYYSTSSASGVQRVSSGPRRPRPYWNNRCIFLLWWTGHTKTLTYQFPVGSEQHFFYRYFEFAVFYFFYLYLHLWLSFDHLHLCLTFILSFFFVRSILFTPCLIVPMFYKTTIFWKNLSVV